MQSFTKTKRNTARFILEDQPGPDFVEKQTLPWRSGSFTVSCLNTDAPRALVPSLIDGNGTLLRDQKSAVFINPNQLMPVV
jgi:hypothetical protein